MGLKSTIISFHASRIARATARDKAQAIADQQRWLQKLVSTASNTKFGQDHNFSSIRTAHDFSRQIPIRGYEELRPYIDKILAGGKDILWKGRPKYFGKTSGTTSGVKYIPITSDSIKEHINTASRAVFNYVHTTRENLFDGKVMFISGSPVLHDKSGIKTGRLSGIVNHEIPRWLKPGQAPSYRTNCIEEWEIKLDKIVEETHKQDLRLISGIPPWVQMYYEKLIEKTGKSTIKEVFPNLMLFVYGGVNYAPYKTAIDKLHGAEIPSVETYPASEGFIAYQDDYRDPSLLLNTNAGMYFEFVPLSEIDKKEPKRLTLADVQKGIDYAILISSNAGLWAYNIGDTVRFTSLDPYKLRVSGRIKHFISAFGEHVIAKEVEEAIEIVSRKYQLTIKEFTVAPQVSPPEGGLPYHEWFIEFEQVPDQLDLIAFDLDEEVARQNIYYHDLLSGRVLQTLKITPVSRNGFRAYMESIGKLGGQNKVPRLQNNRDLVDQLRPLS